MGAGLWGTAEGRGGRKEGVPPLEAAGSYPEVDTLGSSDWFWGKPFPIRSPLPRRQPLIHRSTSVEYGTYFTFVQLWNMGNISHLISCEIGEKVATPRTPSGKQKTRFSAGLRRFSPGVASRFWLKKTPVFIEVGKTFRNRSNYEETLATPKDVQNSLVLRFPRPHSHIYSY